MLDIQFSAKEVLVNSEQFKNASFSTKDARLRELSAAVSELASELGYGVRNAANLNSAHISALVDHWKNNNIKDSTIRNRLISIRIVAKETNHPGIVKSNAEYGVTEVLKHSDKAIVLTSSQLAKLAPLEQAAAKLASAFALRMEESLKTNPRELRDGRLVVQGTKGSRGRELVVETQKQRDALAFARSACANAGTKNQIAGGNSFKKAKNDYRNNFRQAVGHSKTHGLRHEAAQEKYLSAVGNGATHDEARQIVSVYLGHDRLSVVDVYCSSVYA